jgi:hypothetical protein
MLKASAGRLSGAFRTLPIALAIVVVVVACGTVFAANNAVPSIDLPTVPSAAIPGGAGFTLTVNGAGFVNGSVVNWNGSPRVTTFVSAAQVTSEVLASDITTASTASITVSNPAPGGGTSNVVYVEVTTPASSVIVAGVQIPALAIGFGPIAADINNDGKPDLIFFVETQAGESPYVALGNGDGTFQSPVAIGGALVEVTGNLALADFNKDGKLDIALIAASSFPSTISILLGNGDGTFQTPMVTGSQNNTAYGGLVVGDFNQDGNLDIITDYANPPDSGISLLLGNGDGTFQSPVNDSMPYGCSGVGDFNGDGKLDLLCFDQISIAVLAGNGDGTFQAAVTSPFGGITGIYVAGMSVTDLNGDGKLDVIFQFLQDHPEAFWVAAEIGNGDGTFQAGSTSVGGIAAFPPGDFNGDGKLDLVTSAGQYPFPVDDLSVWIGNGDGTFGAAGVPIATRTGLSLTPLIQGDFNGDGEMDLLALDKNGGIWLFLQGSFPAGTLSPASMNFANQTVGTTSASQIITLTNTGTETLTLSAVTVEGTNASEFKQTNTCAATLAVSAACQITVTFAPAASGIRSATLNIPHDGIGSQTVPLTGTGDTTVPTVTLSPGALNFVSQAVGTTSSAIVTLTNPGAGTVTAPTISVTGTNAGDFSQVNTCSSELLAGTSCQVTVTFKPTTVGSRSASLNISDNASGSPQSVALTGSGPDFYATLPNPLSLTIAAGQTANYTFEVTPLGGFSQTVALTCVGVPPQSKCTLPASITLNGSANMTVVASVTTTAASVAMNRHTFSSKGRWLASGLFGLPLIVSLAGVGVRPRRPAYRLTLLLLVITAMLLIPACGGGHANNGTGSMGTPAGTYLLTVTGEYTSGGTTLTHSTTLTLTVQ